MINELPIKKHIPEIKKALSLKRCAVVQAPPGAGKTTQVPLALLDEPWLKGKTIILLEPRRLAAIHCAKYMAEGLNQRVGQAVGYQIRLDSKIGPQTRIKVITEGIFTRMIQSDPSLADIGLVIFDEFHERNIHSDLGLALCLETADALNETLRILVMSATMDVDAVSKMMNHAPIIDSKGKSFPVKTLYLPAKDYPHQQVFFEARCANAVQKALFDTRGDILVFLPGAGEIRRLQRILKETVESQIDVIPLFGALSAKDQSSAFRPSSSGMRKVVLATAIAETSLTMTGIRVVIDSGRMRVPRFSPKTGMSRLETIPVSKASADQRRGRAGRTQKGICYRLWSEYDHGLLKPFSTPEILSVDLTSLVLELAAWGVSDPDQLNWLDSPDKTSFKEAALLLKALGALDDQEKITRHGKKMVSIGLHPRFSHMIIKSKDMGLGFLSCRIAAFLNERDFLQFDKGMADPDIMLRLELIEAAASGKKMSQPGCSVNRAILNRILKTEQKIAKQFGIKTEKPDIHYAGSALAYAFPDRIGKKREQCENKYHLASGKGAFFKSFNTMGTNQFIVAVYLDGNPTHAKIFLAAKFDKESLKSCFKDQIETTRLTMWDKKTEQVVSKAQTRFNHLIIEERVNARIDSEMAADILIQQIKKKGLAILPWTKKLNAMRTRATFLKQTIQSKQLDQLPDLSDQALESALNDWLTPFIWGMVSFKQLQKVDLKSAIGSFLTWDHTKLIEKMAPSHIIVPSGSKKPIRYEKDNKILTDPIVEVRLQEMFGFTGTPTIANGKIALTLHLLSPAGRVVQITKDLASFWENTYPEVKKDLMGRYPKHYWPDDPLVATPTSRVKPKK